MRHLLFVFAAFPLAAQSVQYQVSVPDPASRLFHVDATFPASGLDTLYVSLPAWSPGNYAIQNYSRFVRHFGARDGSGRALFWDRADKDTWRVPTGGAAAITVSFDELADTLDLSMARIHGDLAQFLGTNLFLYQPGHLDRPAEVRFALPAGWRVTTALKTGANGTYLAPDYHVLADAETFLGRFSVDSLQVSGKWIRIAVWPAADYTPAVAATMRASVSKMAEVQDRLMGGPPYDVYTIFFDVVRDTINWAGGLEHLNSQFDVMPAGPGFADAGGTLGGFMNPLMAHEFFHLWNVKRIRPAEMWPYEYRDEQYTPLLWWSEGVTDYYADLTNWRAGIFSDADFIDHVHQNIDQVNTAPEPWSEEDGSVATWINEVYVNSSQLYYPKGSLTGLLLDISIRDATDNAHSLDDVMRTLFTRYYQAGKGFTTGQLLDLLRENGMPEVQSFYQHYINGRDSLPYAAVFAKAGLEYAVSHTTSPTLGIQTSGNLSVLTAVLPGSPADAAGLQAGDTLRRIGDITIDPTVDFGPEFRARYHGKAGAPLDIVIHRAGREQTLHTTVRERPVEALTLGKVPSPNPKQARIWHGLATGTTGR
ncbi:MAG TPA: PDZ domain-containing protein [Gemmatimonadales bacterium]|nr:PDZ domain-containing protein [Gemmatimonadales bacterium]